MVLDEFSAKIPLKNKKLHSFGWSFFCGKLMQEGNTLLHKTESSHRA